ncbi:MAG: homoaconitate hydratase [Candidatus Thorarchaeota archaeon]|jgi:isopropylmalate/homocitrate/citramalate synthase
MTLIHDNSVDHIKKNLPKRVYMWDETLRDGEQTPGVFFTLNEKIRIAKLLDEMGIFMIDLGFPSVSEEEKKTVKIIANENLNAKTGVTVRADIEDINDALYCDVDRVFIFISTSPLHMRHKLKLNEESVMKKAVDCVEYAKNHGLTADFISEDTMRSDLNFVSKIFNKVTDFGAEILMITDTVGVAEPDTIENVVNTIKNNIRNKIKLGIHCHNDFGLATVNTLTAVKRGILYPTTTVNGIGERAGNAAFEEVVMALEKIYGVDTRIKTEKLNELSNLVKKCSGVYISPHKPIVGLNAFRHESGIHVHGLLKNPLTYEPLQPEMVGRKREFVLGKHSGTCLIKDILEKEGINATDGQIKMITEKVKDFKERSPKRLIFEMINTLNDYNRLVLGFPKKVFREIAFRVVNGFEENNSGENSE